MGPVQFVLVNIYHVLPYTHLVHIRPRPLYITKHLVYLGACRISLCGIKKQNTAGLPERLNCIVSFVISVNLRSYKVNMIECRGNLQAMVVMFIFFSTVLTSGPWCDGTFDTGTTEFIGPSLSSSGGSAARLTRTENISLISSDFCIAYMVLTSEVVLQLTTLMEFLFTHSS